MIAPKGNHIADFGPDELPEIEEDQTVGCSLCGEEIAVNEANPSSKGTVCNECLYLLENQ